MAADIQLATIFRRESMLINDDSLVSLYHEGYQDRVHKILYDHIESIVTWRVIPWARMLIFAILFGLPAALCFIPGEEEFNYLGLILLSFSLITELYYLYCGKTVVRINKIGEIKEFEIIARPGKVRNFIAGSRINIENFQRQAAMRAEAELNERADADRERIQNLSGESLSTTKPTT